MKEKEYKLIIPKKKFFYKLLNIINISNNYNIHNDCIKTYDDFFYDTKNFDFLKSKFYFRKRIDYHKKEIELTIKELKKSIDNIHIRDVYTTVIPTFEYKYIPFNLKKFICSITKDTNFFEYNLLFKIKQKRIFKFIKYDQIKNPIALLSLDIITINKNDIPNIFLEVELESITCDSKELESIFYGLLQKININKKYINKCSKFERFFYFYDK